MTNERLSFIATWTCLWLSVFILAGCFSLTTAISKQKSNPIPTAPISSPSAIEDKKLNAAIIQDIANHADNNGLVAHSTTSGTLKDCADILVMYEGLPVDKIDWRVKEQVERLHERIKKDEQKYRDDLSEWMLKIDQLSRDNNLLQNEIKEKNGIIENLKTWFWRSVIALALITFFFPTIGIWIIKFLMGRAKNAAEKAVVAAKEGVEGQMKEIARAIEEHKNKHPEDAEKLLPILSKHMDRDTKNKIKELLAK